MEWEKLHPIDELTVSSLRLREFRSRIAEAIPIPGGNAEERSLLNRMPLTRLLATYVNWADRFIPQRKRQVMEWDGFWLRNDPRRFAGEINAIIALSNEGGDLTPYLSSKVHSEGFSPRAASRPGVDWGGKDRALNAYDLHHLHLKPANAAGKRSGGSDALLYVDVGRDEMLLLMLGDHRSFDSGELRQAIADWTAGAGRHLRGVEGVSPVTSADMGARLMVRGINASTMSADKVTFPTSLTASGHSMYHVRYADRIALVLEELDPLLNAEMATATLRLRLGDWYSDNPDWEWSFDGLDLLLVDKSTQQAGLIVSWRR